MPNALSRAFESRSRRFRSELIKTRLAAFWVASVAVLLLLISIVSTAASAFPKIEEYSAVGGDAPAGFFDLPPCPPCAGKPECRSGYCDEDLSARTKTVAERVNFLRALNLLRSQKGETSRGGALRAVFDKWYRTLLTLGIALVLGVIWNQLPEMLIPIDLTVTSEVARLDGTRLSGLPVGLAGQAREVAENRAALAVSALPPKLLRSVFLDARFREFLSEMERECVRLSESANQEGWEFRGRIGEGLGLPVPDEGAFDSVGEDRLKDAAWKALVHRFVQDSTFAYLLKEKALAKRSWSERLPDLADHFKKQGAAGRLPMGDAGMAFLVAGLIGVPSLTGYLTANAIDKSVKEESSQLHERLTTLSDSLQEISSVASSTQKDKEVDKSDSFFYYPVSPVETPPDKNGKAAPPAPLSFTCAPQQLVSAGAKGSLEDLMSGAMNPATTALPAKAVPSVGTGSEQNSIVCAPIQKVELAGCCGANDANKPPPPQDWSVVVRFEQKGHSHSKPCDPKGTTTPSWVEAIRIPTSGSSPAGNDCYELSLNPKTENDPNVIQLKVQSATPNAAAISASAGRMPIFSQDLKAYLSLVEYPDWGGWPPKRWFVKGGSVVIRIGSVPKG